MLSKSLAFVHEDMRGLLIRMKWQEDDAWLPVNRRKGTGTYDFKIQNPTYELFR